MTFDLHIPVEGLVTTLSLSLERVEDLQRPLREFGGVLRKEAIEKVRTGTGLPPIAEATRKKREHTGTSLVTKHGTLRVSLAAKLDRQSKRLVALEAWAKKRYYGFGKYLMPADVVKKLARHRAKLDRLNKQIAKINETDYAERKGSKSVAARRGTTRLGARFASSIKTKVLVKGSDGMLVVYSRIPWSGVQNDGGTVGHGSVVPASKFLVLRKDHFDRFARILVKHGLGEFKT